MYNTESDIQPAPCFLSPLMKPIMNILCCRLILSIALIAALLCSCSDTTAPDPCSGSEPVTAHFTMYESLDGKAVAADTVLFGNFISFAADKKYDSYQWRIGTDARVWRDSVVRLRFEKAEGDVPVYLIVHGKPNTACFANDDGIDTVKKILHVAGGWEKTRVLGNYHGHNTDAPRDTFTFSIEYKDLGDFGKRFIMNNLNPGCTEPAQDGAPAIDISIGYRSFQFVSTGWVGMGCDDPEGIAILQGDGDSVVVQYTLVDLSDVSKRIPKTFIGKRVD